MELINNFFEWAKNKKWKVHLSVEKKSLPNKILQRYLNIPDEYKYFYERIDLCTNETDTNWFITESDFLEYDEGSFSWNSFEKMSLEAAENDEDLLNEVKSFWDLHLPIMLCIGGDYEYYAINVNNGNIVNGYEPAFEESSFVSDSFSTFLSKIISGEIKV